MLLKADKIKLDTLTVKWWISNQAYMHEDFNDDLYQVFLEARRALKAYLDKTLFSHLDTAIAKYNGFYTYTGRVRKFYE